MLDVSPTKIGLEGVQLFGHSRARGGLAVGVAHAYDFRRVQPDLEAYGVVSIETRSHWDLMSFFGAGLATEEHKRGSMRMMLELSKTAPIAFRATTLAILTPVEKSIRLETKLGPSIQLRNAPLRIYTYVGVEFDLVARKTPSSHLNPGCALILSL